MASNNATDALVAGVEDYLAALSGDEFADLTARVRTPADPEGKSVGAAAGRAEARKRFGA